MKTILSIIFSLVVIPLFAHAAHPKLDRSVENFVQQHLSDAELMEVSIFVGAPMMTPEMFKNGARITVTKKDRCEFRGELTAQEILTLLEVPVIKIIAGISDFNAPDGGNCF